MSGAPTVPDLAGLTLSSADPDGAANGFSRRHTAEAGHIVQIARRFCDGGYGLEMMTCEDRRQDAGAMRLVYMFASLDPVDRHLVIVDLPPEVPGAEAPSVAGVFRGADWYEREVYDMYGVHFSGHPDLKRILLPEDADFHALLKDFGRVDDAPEHPGPFGGGPGA